MHSKKGAKLLLCCAVLCCAVLCCAVLCCAVLCCAVLSDYKAWHFPCQVVCYLQETIITFT
ncbi:hypothetical protein [Lactococcus formosensis]|uniref:hypothetical protein n=1 Tax=Lactococcus formosensis TaxID=1281486 RepID=UPI002435DD7C|nr:hypothetical protein [Lactococcus formosensis]MDG6129801.1 hypothetical protein [Lactococcus formosensis]